jgi:hypothetical protein
MMKIFKMQLKFIMRSQNLQNLESQTFLTMQSCFSKIFNPRPSQYSDDYRHPSAAKDGGFANHDAADVAKL